MLLQSLSLIDDAAVAAVKRSQRCCAQLVALWVFSVSSP